MDELNTVPDTDADNEQYPLEPRYHPVHKFTRRIYDFLASSKLAIVLLVTILACCVAGVTVYRGQRAAEMIFTTLWFNSLLVFLVINVACCFFGRIWGRKVTIISFGMILFHLSFVTMFAGIIYNSLYHFRGDMRITEGETLINRQRQSYEGVERGRFFSLLRLKGETTLNRLLAGYQVGQDNKRVAYDISVNDSGVTKQGIIYLTRNLNYKGFTYIPDREGYSLLAVLYDKQGNELYGAHIPLQSLRQKDQTFLYTTGTKEGAGTIPYPQAPDNPLFNLRLTYTPNPTKERSGDVAFLLWPPDTGPAPHDAKPIAEGRATIGDAFTVGEYSLVVKEVRYWVIMSVNYEPGQPIVLGSLWVGLSGMIITTIGRILRGRKSAKLS